MSERVARKIRQECRRHYRFDMDGFVGDVMDLPLHQRWGFCYRVLFKVGRKDVPWYRRMWNRIFKKGKSK